MAYIITDKCAGVKDKACVDVCPVDCIHGKDEDVQMYINPDECIDCGACDPVCPVEAIKIEDDLEPEEQKFIALNKDYFLPVA